MALTDAEIREDLAMCEALGTEPWHDLNLYFMLWNSSGHRQNRDFCYSVRAHYAEVLQQLLQARARIAELEAESYHARNRTKLADDVGLTADELIP